MTDDITCQGCGALTPVFHYNGGPGHPIGYEPGTNGVPAQDTLKFRCTDDATGRFLDFTMTVAVAIGEDGECVPNSDASDCTEGTPCSYDVTIDFDVDGGKLIDFPDDLTVVFKNPFGTGTDDAPIYPQTDDEGNEIPHGEISLFFPHERMFGTACGKTADFDITFDSLAPSADGFTFTNITPATLRLHVECEACECSAGGGGGPA